MLVTSRVGTGISITFLQFMTLKPAELRQKDESYFWEDPATSADPVLLATVPVANDFEVKKIGIQIILWRLCQTF